MRRVIGFGLLAVAFAAAGCADKNDPASIGDDPDALVRGHIRNIRDWAAAIEKKDRAGMDKHKARFKEFVARLGKLPPDQNKAALERHKKEFLEVIFLLGPAQQKAGVVAMTPDELKELMKAMPNPPMVTFDSGTQTVGWKKK